MTFLLSSIVLAIVFFVLGWVASAKEGFDSITKHMTKRELEDFYEILKRK
jgi:hypothetical protein